MHFAAQAGGPTLLHAQLPTGTILENLQGAASVPGKVSSSQMAYAGILPGTDLLYNVSSSNLEALLLLHNATGPTSYTLVYHLPGAKASQDASGNIIFTDAQGKRLLVVGGLFMYEADASGQMLPTAAGTQNIQVSLSQQGSDFLVTLTPDHTWLTASGRHFPVAIDPSQTWQGGDGGASTTDGNIYADTVVESGNPTIDYWNMNNLRIGNCGNLGNGTTRSFLKFPIDPAPANAHITSASLSIYQSSQYSGGLGVPVNAQLVYPPWDVTNLTWNNQPTNTTWVGQSNTANTQLNWVTWNVSKAALLWWQGNVALNGFMMSYSNESQQCQLFFSDNNSDNSHHPTLTINYVQDQTPPTGQLLFNGGAASTNNLTVSVQPNALDPGSISEWNSNWSTVNGISSNPASHGEIPAHTSVNGAGIELDADTSSCGSSAC